MRHVLLGMADPGFVPEQGTRRPRSSRCRSSARTGRATGPSCPAIRSRSWSMSARTRRSTTSTWISPCTSPATTCRRTDLPRGIDLGRFDKKRVRFKIQGFPYDPGKYWVTIGGSSRTTGHLYHVQTQRYLFEVFDAPRAQERVDVPVGVEVEDL